MAAAIAGALPWPIIDSAALGMVAGRMIWRTSFRANPARPFRNRFLVMILILLAGFITPLLASIITEAMKCIPIAGSLWRFLIQPMIAAVIIG